MSLKDRFSLVKFSVRHPWIIIAFTTVLTLIFFTRLSGIKTDTNPKNMLPATAGVRVLNDEVDRTFGLYEDVIVLGIVDEKAGVLSRDALSRIKRLTTAIQAVKGVAARDVSSLSTIDNVTPDAGGIRVGPLASIVPGSEAGLLKLKEEVLGNPLFINRMVSKDGHATGIFIPLEKGADAKAVSDAVRTLVKGDHGGVEEHYYVAGDPVARDTFGAEMFKLMAVFSPIAGVVMFVAAFVMFRSVYFSIFIMLPAMVVIIWSMGLLAGLGFPIHIMSSMMPVFLMAIATDSIHIFNEFLYRYRETNDKGTAIAMTMKAVGVPLIYTDITTAVGFGGLLLANIIPVRVFGLGVGFGTLSLLVSSFTLVPAFLSLLSEGALAKARGGRGEDATTASALLGRIAGVGINMPRITAAVGIVLVITAVYGMTKITVNNNMVEWFKKTSDVRVADRVMNAALGGTATAYYVAESLEDDYIKTPEAMRYIDGLQRRIEALPSVGKTFSVVDYVKRINQVLHDGRAEFYAVSGKRDEIGQYLFLFGMSAKPSDLDNVVDYPFRKANIWIQLKTWDVQAMRDVIKAVGEYKKAHPSPMEFRPAGTAYFNLVWNDEVLMDMVKGFAASMVIVFVILAVNFRSVLWAIVGYAPLLFTIVVIYGVVGFAGKSFDMPIAVLSCLSLGMAVDFSIHFISRFKDRLKELKECGKDADMNEALLWTAVRPGKGIMRNALLFAGAFSVMLFAPLTPYVTVGAFIASMMLLSALLTLVYMPALIIILGRWLIKEA